MALLWVTQYKRPEQDVEHKTMGILTRLSAARIAKIKASLPQQARAQRLERLAGLLERLAVEAGQAAEAAKAEVEGLQRVAVPVADLRKLELRRQELISQLQPTTLEISLIENLLTWSTCHPSLYPAAAPDSESAALRSKVAQYSTSRISPKDAG